MARISFLTFTLLSFALAAQTLEVGLKASHGPDIPLCWTQRKERFRAREGAEPPDGGRPRIPNERTGDKDRIRSSHKAGNDRCDGVRGGNEARNRNRHLQRTGLEHGGRAVGEAGTGQVAKANTNNHNEVIGKEGVHDNRKCTRHSKRVRRCAACGGRHSLRFLVEGL